MDNKQSKAAPTKISVIVDDSLMSRIWAEQRRVKETTGFQVSQSQIAARLLDQHLPQVGAGAA